MRWMRRSCHPRPAKRRPKGCIQGEEGDSALEAASEANDPGEEPPLEEGDGFLREWGEECAKRSHWGELWAQTQVTVGHGPLECDFTMGG